MATYSARTLKASLGFTSLTTPDGYNPKLKKGRAQGYSSLILHLAPAKLSGYDVCQYASDRCRAVCLNTAGHGGIIRRGETTNAIQTARIARTRWLFEDRPSFMAQLAHEITTHIRRARAHGMTPAVRLNGTSDLPWEKITGPDGRTILDSFERVQFYDYTKSAGRALAFAAGLMPSNYHLTFSRSESNALDVSAVLRAGVNVAAVFATAELPAEWNGSPVISGDHDDLRFLDRRPAIVGLKAKGKARRDISGFVIRPEDARPALVLPMFAQGMARPSIAI
jgi:hypothetical protein